MENQLLIQEPEALRLPDLREHPNSFGEDADGELYITSESGNVFKIIPQ